MSEILFLAHRIPFPPDRGDKIRSFHELKHLAGLGRVHLACFADDEADAAHLTGLREALGGALGEAHVEVRRSGRAAAGARALLEGKPVSLTLFDSARFRAFVAGMLRERPIGAVFVFSGQMAQFVPEVMSARFVMDFGDVDSAKFEEYGRQSGAMAAIHRREGTKLAAFEREVAARADVSLFVSEAEAALFRDRSGLASADVRALQNGVDLEYYDPSAAFPKIDEAAPLIVFTGQMDYAPNIDAVRWFAEDVLPLLAAARFAIVGRNPPEAVRRLARERVVVTGSVPDVRSWLVAADVVVAPLRIARGIQNKVLEAMAMARPVVASPAAFEGIEAEPGRHLVVADGADAQAAAISSLLADPGRARTLGAAARQRMVEAYRWEARLAPLADILGLTPGRAAA
ncbi:MAG TPA: TIGR03087 family PEP-CTERM/XrtA system glycosyltransferase [Allosphingosinicella sp.]|nr:TIGR03087 family PEP-CTERM/XrtA system glycosyltransferase [Allosphingosinicella sp.]